MPIAHIYMIEGRSEDVKEDMIVKVSAALAESTGAPIEAIKIIVQEVPSTHWGTKGTTAKALGR